MRLNARCEYGLRVMLDLALRDEQTTLEEIAARQGVPATMMPGLVHALAKAGLAETARGHGGGVRLGREAGEITVRAVLDALERPLHIPRCGELHTHCPRAEAACALRELWEQTESAVLGVWERTTLADLARTGSRREGRERWHSTARR